MPILVLLADRRKILIVGNCPFIIRNESHNACPLCQRKLDKIDDSWVLPDLPKSDEVNEKIINELNALAYSSDDGDPENDNSDDD